MYTLNSVFFSVSITFSSIHPCYSKKLHPSPITSFHVPKKKMEKSALFPSGQEIILHALTLVLPIPTDNVYLLFNELLNR